MNTDVSLADAAIVRAAVLDTCANGLPAQPLKVEPQQAPADALTSEEQAAVKALRASLESKLTSLDEAERVEAEAHLDDFTLARFSIARDHKLADAEQMFLATMTFRAGKKINTLRAELHPTAVHPPGTSAHLRHATVRNHFHAGWGGNCRDGSPFFVELMGKLDVASIDKDADLFELMMDGYACTYLENAFASVRLAAARSGRMQRATLIVDASGASLAMLTHMRVIKSVAKIGTSFCARPRGGSTLAEARHSTLDACCVLSAPRGVRSRCRGRPGDYEARAHRQRAVGRVGGVEGGLAAGARADAQKGEHLLQILCLAAPRRDRLRRAAREPRRHAQRAEWRAAV